MNKQFIVFTLVSAFFVSVVTAVLHQTGLGSPYLTFPVLSLLVPVLLQRMRQGQFGELPLHMGTMYTVGPFLQLLIYSLRRSM